MKVEKGKKMLLVDHGKCKIVVALQASEIFCSQGLLMYELSSSEI